MKPRLSPPFTKRIFEFVLAFFITSTITVILFLLRARLNTSTVVLIYFIPILVSTTIWSLWPGVLAAFTAFLSYNFFFLQPYYTFVVHETQDMITLIIFLIITVFVSQLVGRARSSLAAAIDRESETTRLYELSLDLAGVSNLDEIATIIAHKTAETVKIAQIEIKVLQIDEDAVSSYSIPENFKANQKADAIIPLETVRTYIGEIQLWLNGALLTPGEERLLRTFAAQGALAIERTTLAHVETRAKVLEESDRMKSALLSSVSHEFRTPIATIKAATTSLLMDEIPWDVVARIDLLSTIDEDIDYLNYLVGNLLDMSRIETGALRPNLQWNILAEILDGVINRMHRILSNFHLDVQISDDLPLVPVDYVQIEQVFTNLLHNSAKYSPKGSIIQISAHVVENNMLMVIVKNTGPQISPEHLTHIFDKFYRLTEPEKVSGTGLGLSICKGIIEAHHGHIWAENIPGGLAFFFTLPLILDGNLPPQIKEED